MQYFELMLSSVEILILAAIQGISEFLPVSSVAHLVLVSKYYAFNNQNLLIDLCLHCGSLIAIIFYFRKDLLNPNSLPDVIVIPARLTPGTKAKT